MFGIDVVKVHVAVVEPPAVRLTLDGQETAREVDGVPPTVTEVVRVTAPEKPVALPIGRLWKVMTEKLELPEGKKTELGLAERLNPGLVVPPMLKLSEKPPVLEGSN